MKAIIFILVAVQIAYSYGQSLDQAVDDAIDQLNEDSIIDNLVAVVKQINVNATLKKQGLIVKLKLKVQETNCSKETTNLFSICVPKPKAKKHHCEFVITYESCELKSIDIAKCMDLLPDEDDMPILEDPFNMSSNSSTSTGSSSE